MASSDVVSMFCKVDAVCTHGELNWLGWLVIAIAGSAFVFFIGEAFKTSVYGEKIRDYWSELVERGKRIEEKERLKKKD